LALRRWLALKDGTKLWRSGPMIARVPYSFSLAILLTWAFQCAWVRGDADFESVRVLMTEDSSGKGGDPKEKYWREWSIPMASWHFVLTAWRR